VTKQQAIQAAAQNDLGTAGLSPEERYARAFNRAASKHPQLFVANDLPACVAAKFNHTARIAKFGGGTTFLQLSAANDQAKATAAQSAAKSGVKLPAFGPGAVLKHPADMMIEAAQRSAKSARLTTVREQILRDFVQGRGGLTLSPLQEKVAVVIEDLLQGRDRPFTEQEHMAAWEIVMNREREQGRAALRISAQPTPEPIHPTTKPEPKPLKLISSPA
jgi:hypothetical protein